MRIAAALGLLAALTTARQAPPLDPIVEAAAAYVRQYQEQLTAIVADEVYKQEIKAQSPRDRAMPFKRTLQSEIFFMFTPGQDWMAIRDVIEMDRMPVGDRPDLKNALRTLPAPQVARQFKAYNSRFNLGRVARNFNEPTFGLLVLDDRHRGRFSFERVRAQREDGEQRTVIAFRERRSPTLIADLKGGDVYSTGELTIEPRSGRVTRSVMAMTIGTVSMTMTTTYGPDARLGIWVPLRFGEYYRDGSKTGPYYEEILCEARYSTYRQFEVRARIR